MNAIILAAGVGHRMYELTRTKNKVFLSIGGMPIIEQLIIYLKEAGIDDITIVTGHRNEMFQPLANQYHVKLLLNRYYSLCNNLYSLKLAFGSIDDTIILHGDVALFKNIFLQMPKKSFAYTVLHNSKGIPQRHPVIDENQVIQHIETRMEDAYITTLLGIYYFCKEDVARIQMFLDLKLTQKLVKNYYLEWEDILIKELFNQHLSSYQIDRKYAIDVNDKQSYFYAIKTYETYWKI